MGAIVLVHRWLGIAFCPLFAMWFATGIVMHFVPFPSLTETERFAGLASVEKTRVAISPLDAVRSSGLDDAERVRLIQRGDGPVYVISGPSRLRAIQASDGTDASIRSPDIALAAAVDHARRRGLDVSHRPTVELADYDQWTVPNSFDRYRPLFRAGLGDAAGTEAYVSSVTGEVVLYTTRSERWWNCIGGVVHWIYPTVLRSNWSRWDKVVWTLSLLALIAAALGAVLGIARVRRRMGLDVSPYRGWHALHHFIGLISMVFVLTWIFSGWLSMDHGRLFSDGRLSKAEAAAIATRLAWYELAEVEMPFADAKEIEWFGFDRQLYRRERTDVDKQTLVRLTGSGSMLRREFLEAREINDLVQRLSPKCAESLAVAATDDYPTRPSMPGAPVYRAICGDVWFQVDGASGAVLERLDSSRRAYRWLYSALHTADIPRLLPYTHLRTALIVSFCSLGLVFSMTGVVIGWRRLGRAFVWMHRDLGRVC